MDIHRWTCVVGAAALLAASGCAARTPAAPARDLPEPTAPFVNPGATVADYLDCLRDKDVMIVSAHRGGPTPGYPENGLETFAESLSHAPFFIETDVRMTADGVFVLLHDEDLARTTTGAGLISQTPLSALTDVRLVDNDGQATDHAVTTLADALEWARGRAVLQLDVKRGAPIAEVAEQVAAAGAEPYAAVIAYSVEDALAAANAAPEVTVSVQVLDLDMLDALETGGLPPDRIMAWTGIQFERPALWAALNDRGVSAAWGSLWYLDVAIHQTGAAEEFARLADAGLDVLSSDYHRDAYTAVNARQDTPAAVAACNSG